MLVWGGSAAICVLIGFYVVFDESIRLHSRRMERSIWMACYVWAAVFVSLQLDFSTASTSFAVLVVLPLGWRHKNLREQDSLVAYPRGLLHAQIPVTHRAEALAGWVRDMSRSIRFQGLTSSVLEVFTGKLAHKKRKIVRVLASCSPDELNYVLTHINLPKLLQTASDELMQLLLVDSTVKYMALTRGVLLDACEKVYVSTLAGTQWAGAPGDP